MDYSLLLVIETIEINKKYLDRKRISSVFEKVSNKSYDPENPQDSDDKLPTMKSVSVHQTTVTSLNRNLFESNLLRSLSLHH